MTTAAPAANPLSADYVNPVIQSAIDVFQKMLNCKVKRTDLTLKETTAPLHELSAIIGVSGKASGTYVPSLSEQVAIEILHRMVGIEATELDDDVCDAAGEILNMIAGQAKAKLQKLELSISLPSMITGKNHEIRYPSDVRAICVLFESEIGPFAIEVGFAS
jgi:chemotaxis protein CheX